MPRLSNQILLCDADDTLWENNGYFLDALVSFLDIVEARGESRLRAEKKLREVEAIRTKTAGYGSLNYAISLCQTYELLLGPMPADERARIEAIGRSIYEHEIELLPRVRETVAELVTRHELWIVTKGHREEQLGKIVRSGIAGFFRGHEILPEKNVDTYADLVRRHGFDPERTWMIGNSPKSDMNPAAHAGLRTVYVPHRTIWEFERAEFMRQPDIEIPGFAALTDHF